MKKILFIFFVLAAGIAVGQNDIVTKYAETITLEDLKKHLGVIASDKYEGRNTGEKGQKMAARYLKKAFKKYSLTGPSKKGDPYYQEIKLSNKNCKEFTIKSEKLTLENGTDFMYLDFMGGGFEGEAEYDVVFVGFGLESDYKVVDVDGKVAMYFTGEPSDNKKQNETIKQEGENIAIILNNEKMVTAKNMVQ